MNWRQRVEPVIRPLMHAFWRLSRGTTLGVRGIVVRADGRVILVRHTYVGGWHLPGGGVEKGESVRDALTHELRDEAGVALAGEARVQGVHANHRTFRGDHVVVCVVRDWSRCESNAAGEIAETGWFDPDNLPDGTTPATRARLAEFRDQAPVADNW
ncbi:NUDIX domain-containing protein [Maricaulis maris]|uniref:NUDIX domain-containing protein n=1 Tax=Maricaulis maris TaxID=74318 RepID=UPI003B8CFC5E